ncbi:hypothetical protein PTT_07695 [Pyrenophora teres f. teres 0-1]|uniref:Uncharacterized protein n=1 Tax=Pyrenophora teres f. teres (strain 0-1) TaxID=861557 RepID=E3RI78_PYRTT|nr:hypothetical protein PTT_07695 [Pyrenophora teres f. teres 0-1]
MQYNTDSRTDTAQISDYFAPYIVSKRLLAYRLITSKNYYENLAYILSKAFHAFR